MKSAFLTAVATAFTICAPNALAAEPVGSDLSASGPAGLNLTPAVRRFEQAPLERSLGADQRIQVTTDEEQTSLAVQFGWNRAYGKYIGTPKSVAGYTTFSFGGSVPLSDASSSKLTSLDALPSGGAIEAKFANTRITRAKSFNPVNLTAICSRYRLAPLPAGMESNGGCVSNELTPDGITAFNAELWGERPMLTTFGFGGRAGTETFDYLDPMTLAERSADKSSWSLKAFWARTPLDGPWLITLGFEHLDTYEAADDAILCPSGAAVAADCVYGPGGPPTRTKKDILSGEYRYAFDNFAVSGLLQYDANNDVFAAEVPIFLSRGEDGAFNGGLKVSWRSDTDDVVAAVFVGVPFSLGVPTN